MNHYIEDKEFLGRMRRTCLNLINQLVQAINNDSFLTVKAQLVGSGGKNLETQNANEPIDLDFNLCIVEYYGNDINDCREIKEYVRKMFNMILNKNDWSNCQDSTSCLTTEKRHFQIGNQTEFSIDLAIVCESKEKWYRLIHEKTGYTYNDRYYWNEGPNSKGLIAKVNWLKKIIYGMK